MNTENQLFYKTTAVDIVPTAQRLKETGYRFVQCFGHEIKDMVEVTYSFDRGYEMENYQFVLQRGEGFDSVSTVFPAAFVFENELHDLYGVPIEGIIIDFGGKFYKTNSEFPMLSVGEQDQGGEE